MSEAIEGGLASFTNRMLWSVLAFSQVIYVIVAYLAPPIDPRLETIPMFGSILAVLAIATAIGTAIHRKKALVEPIQAGTLDPTTPQGLGRAFTAFILNLVLSESVAIYGLVLTLLSGDMRWVLVFVGGGLALMWYHRPTSPDLVPPASAGVHRPPPIT